MIAGAFPHDFSNEEESTRLVEVDDLLDQLCATDFPALSELPHDTRQVYRDNRVALIQQSVTNTLPQSLAHCTETGQVCVCWSYLENPAEISGHFLTESGSNTNDASFVLASYQRWSEDCPKRIKGAFVFAIYDPKRQMLLLARDRLGLKPLYYSVDSPCFLFASNAAAIARLDGVNNQLSSDWIAQHLFKHYSDSSSTGFANIKKLPAGHMLILKSENDVVRPRVKAYWRLEELSNSSVQATEASDLVEEYRRSFDRAVAKRSLSNYPLGVELSGGLDSSSIMASLMEQSPSNKMHCFSRAFFSLEPEPIAALNQCYPDAQYHLWGDPESTGLAYQADLARYVELFGLPDEHSLAIGCANFLRVAKQNNVKTLLSGYGGDEFSSSLAHDTALQLADQGDFMALFTRLSGNPIRRLKTIYNLAFRQPSVSSYMPKMLKLDHPALVAVQQRQQEYSLSRSNTKDHNTRMVQRWRHGNVLRLESHTLAATAFGVSFHWPFLDEDLLACYFRSPVTERLGIGNKTRWLHRRALAGRLPKAILDKNNKDVGVLRNGQNPHETFMQRLPGKIDVHSALQSMVDAEELNQFLSSPTNEQKQQPAYRLTAKTIYSINVWLHSFF
ncbi:asparagine synthetase B family protein [Arenicella xantha]|uniref:asparagine synthase (glutamine-hydrolyzing) n=1 Tax=Arenicella xantha TaxID=644221 RepID=A0A395JL63_9GAMM|nr:asparagine synthase-related protein [Arenicella xantha]RBP49931.1 asparagine synthase (glutamine-hydrolysing) [Arenicella xantha]